MKEEWDTLELDCQEVSDSYILNKEAFDKVLIKLDEQTQQLQIIKSSRFAKPLIKDI